MRFGVYWPICLCHPLSFLLPASFNIAFPTLVFSFPWTKDSSVLMQRLARETVCVLMMKSYHNNCTNLPILFPSWFLLDLVINFYSVRLLDHLPSKCCATSKTYTCSPFFLFHLFVCFFSFFHAVNDVVQIYDGAQNWIYFHFTWITNSRYKQLMINVERWWHS